MRKYLRNLRRTSKPPTPKNIYNYMFAKVNRLKSLLQGVFTRRKGIPTTSYNERQANWRLKMVKLYSPECIKEGYCKNCFCEWADGKHYEKDGCILGCYPNWIPEKQWLLWEQLAKLTGKNMTWYKDIQCMVLVDKAKPDTNEQEDNEQTTINDVSSQERDRVQ